MYYKLADWLLIAAAGDIAYTQAVALGDNNGFTIDIVQVTGAATAYDVQRSNDLANWETSGVTGNTAAAPSVTYGRSTTAQTPRYVRVKLTGPAGGNALYSIGINTSKV